MDAQNHTKHNARGNNRRGINLPLNLTMLRQYNAAFTTLRAKINWHAPRPVQVMASLAEIEEYEDATNISWHQLQQFQTIETIVSALTHVRGWPTGMVVDVQERFCILNAYRGAYTTRRLYQKLLQWFPDAVRKRYLELYGDQVLHGQWDNSDGEAYDSDESSYNGDSGQEDYHIFRREEDAAAATNRDLVACTEYGHLVQFLGNLESGTRVSQAFRAHLRRELEDGRYPFPVLNDGVHADFLRP